MTLPKLTSLGMQKLEIYIIIYELSIVTCEISSFYNFLFVYMKDIIMLLHFRAGVNINTHHSVTILYLYTVFKYK